MHSKLRLGLAVAAAAVAAEAGLIHLGRTYGSTEEERRNCFPAMTSSPTPKSRPTTRSRSTRRHLLSGPGWSRWAGPRCLVHRSMGGSAAVPGQRAQCGPNRARAPGHHRRDVHPGRATGDRDWALCRDARVGTSDGTAVQQPPAHELAGPRDAGLDVDLCPDAGRWWPANPLPLPLPLGHRAMVVDAQWLARHRPRRLRDVTRPPEGREEAGRETRLGCVVATSQWIREGGTSPGRPLAGAPPSSRFGCCADPGG